MAVGAIETFQSNGLRGRSVFGDTVAGKAFDFVISSGVEIVHFVEGGGALGAEIVA